MKKKPNLGNGFVLAVAAAVVAASLVFSACNDEELTAKLVEIEEELKPAERARKLMNIDQEYPGNVMVKAFLGNALLEVGEVETAKGVLERGRTLLTPSDSNALHRRVYRDLVKIAVLRSNWSTVNRYAAQLSRFEGEVKQKTWSLWGYALFQLGLPEQAYERYSKVWKEYKSFSTEADYDAYIRLAVDRGAQPENIRVVIRKRIQDQGYRMGIGAVEYTLYRIQERPIDAIGSVLRDLEFGYSRGLLTLQDVASTVRRLIGDLPEPYKAEGEVVIDLFHRHIGLEGKWSPGAAKNEIKASSEPYLRYLAIAARTRNGKPEYSDPAKLHELDDILMDFSGFHLCKWSVHSALEGDHVNPVSLGFLEKSIDAAPSSRSAGKARELLAGAFGISASKAPFLRSKREQQRAIERFFETGAPDKLTIVLDQLRLQNSPFKQYAVESLRELRSLPVVKSYLEKRLADFSGAALEELEGILGIAQERKE
ncbi:MAG: hypothetical protein K9L68_02545 [Spirochaetales bacterium]|nr:hypothetical protein [Spirochaetales bacterium]MCF7937456.1 hypothetical protein [Spirochaetales bacterium]